MDKDKFVNFFFKRVIKLKKDCDNRFILNKSEWKADVAKK